MIVHHSSVASKETKKAHVLIFYEYKDDLNSYYGHFD